jgi:hypothetical protein
VTSPGARIASPTQRELDVGHPVRSFVAVLVAVGLLLVVVEWTGAVHPQVHESSEAVPSLGDGEQQTFVVAVHNDGLLPLRVEDVDWPVERMVNSQIGVAPSTGDSVSYDLEPFEPFTLEGGATRWIGIRVTPACSAWLGALEIRVQTALHLHRWVHLNHWSQDVRGAC